MYVCVSGCPSTHAYIYIHVRHQTRTEPPILLGERALDPVPPNAQVRHDGVEHGPRDVADAVDEEVGEDSVGVLCWGVRVWICRWVCGFCVCLWGVCMCVCQWVRGSGVGVSSGWFGGWVEIESSKPILYMTIYIDSDGPA